MKMIILRVASEASNPFHKFLYLSLVLLILAGGLQTLHGINPASQLSCAVLKVYQFFGEIFLAHLQSDSWYLFESLDRHTEVCSKGYTNNGEDR